MPSAIIMSCGVDVHPIVDDRHLVVIPKDRHPEGWFMRMDPLRGQVCFSRSLKECQEYKYGTKYDVILSSYEPCPPRTIKYAIYNYVTHSYIVTAGGAEATWHTRAGATAFLTQYARSNNICIQDYFICISNI